MESLTNFSFKIVRELKEEIERLRGLLKISGLDGQPSSSQNEDELRERENIIRVEHEKKVGELIDQLKQTEKLMEDANESLFSLFYFFF